MEIVFLITLIVLMVVALGSGFPVAFALPGAAILSIGAAALTGFLLAGDPDAYFSHGTALQWLSAGVTNFRGVYWEVERDTLIAIPLFVFMGIMLQRSKIAEDLLVTMAQLFGPVPGGLGISVVFVGALLAATTGIVGATVVAMGLISLPAMLRNNYAPSLATGTIAASGTLGQIIPPSIVLIILADQLSSAVDQASTTRKSLYTDSTGELSMPSEYDVGSASAGDMFLGAIIPGLILVGLYMAYILVFALIRPNRAPAVGYDGAYDASFAFKVAITLIPPLTLIFLVLGSIIMGVATVNQAGAIGAAGALIMAGYRLMEGQRNAFVPLYLALVSLVLLFTVGSVYDVNVRNIQTTADATGVMLAAVAVAGLTIALIWSGYRALLIDNTLRGVMIDTAKTTSLVFIILLGAAMLTAAFRAFGGEELVRDFLTGLPGGFWTQFMIVMAVIFLLGFFLDFIEIAVVVVPIVAPILLADPSANVTAIWLGVMIGLNIQTSFLTPPFGFALFYLRGVAPAAVKTIDMYKGVIAFICLQIACLFIVAYHPPLVNGLPTRVSLTAETAPPPVNPRLQQCLESHLFPIYDERREELATAIDQASALDASALPEDLREDWEDALAAAAATFGLVEEIRTADAAVEEATPAYRPLHREVRSLERRMTRIDETLEELETDLRRLPETASESQRIALEERMAALQQERDGLEAQIPAEWDERHDVFLELATAEDRARATYRRSVDDAYEPVIELLDLLRGAGQLATFEARVRGLAQEIEGLDGEAAAGVIETLADEIGEIEGTSDIRSPLSAARREIRRDDADMTEVMAELEEAVAAFEAETAWRGAASASMFSGLETYEAAIRDTIGMRQQDRLPDDVAVEVASCMAYHRDVSLNF